MSFFSPINPHFFQPLIPGFLNALSIPIAFFSRYIDGSYQNKTAKLRSSLSHQTWEVKLDGRRLTSGWEEFAVAHDYRIGDFVVFRHEGDMVFYVSAFGPSFCELQYAPSQLQDDTNEEDNIRELQRNVETQLKVSSDLPSFQVNITEYNLHVDKLIFPRNLVNLDVMDKDWTEIVLMNASGTLWTLDLRFNPTSGQFYARRGWRTFCREDGHKAGDSIKFKLVQRDKTTPVLYVCPEESGKDNTQEADEGEEIMSEDERRGRNRSKGKKTYQTKNVRWKPSSSPRQNHFVTLTITPYCLERSKLPLPLKFTKVNGVNKPGTMIMIDKDGGEWPTNLRLKKWKDAGSMYLGTGIEEFLEANDLKVRDSFEVELMWRNNNTTPVLRFCSKINNSDEM